MHFSSNFIKARKSDSRLILEDPHTEDYQRYNSRISNMRSHKGMKAIFNKSIVIEAAKVSILLLLLSQNPIGEGEAVEVNDCSGSGAIARTLNVSINNGLADCTQQDKYCPFVSGKNATIKVDFMTSK